MTVSPARLCFDAVIIGGGVAGLWILNRLNLAGYNAILFEQEALGAGQSIASQGMVHGGVKYTLAGALSGASEAIADMPDYWRACLAGKGNIDLRETKTLSDHFYMWSTESTLSKVTGFLASKSLRGRVNVLPKEQHPPLFANPAFKGKLYQLVDSVIDTGSLLTNLAANQGGRIFKINWQQAKLINTNGVISLHIRNNSTNNPVVIEAGQFIFASGKGNAALLQSIDAIKPSMQTRPLQQVMVKHRHDYLLYAHCIGTDSTPRLTISSHRCHDNSVCWYLGGQLAEQGAKKSAADLIQEAKTELRTLFPWLDWQTAQWATLPVDRAEAQQKNFVRPDNAFMDLAHSTQHHAFSNVLVAWPTKLTLAPHLGDEALRWMQQQGVSPGQHNGNAALLALPVPPLAPAPWEMAEWRS